MQLANGYETMTTFWQDFTIADKFGKKAVIETYDVAFNEWKHDYKYITELSIVLNHKIWQHWESKNEELSKTYNDLWTKLEDYVFENFSEEEIQYYYKITD